LKISIILPTFNEEGNIGPLITALRDILECDHQIQFVVVDDSSEDSTLISARLHLRQSSDILIERHGSRSLGLSILEGLLRADFEYVLVMDTDFTHSPTDVGRLVDSIGKADVIIGSRFVPGGGMKNKPHEFSSRIFNLLLRVVLATPVRDNLGGLWIARKRDIRNHLEPSVFDGYGEYFMRLSSLMKRDGLRLLEIPAYFEKRSSGVSKSKFAKMAVTYLSAAVYWRLKSTKLSTRTQELGDDLLG